MCTSTNQTDLSVPSCIDNSPTESCTSQTACCAQGPFESAQDLLEAWDAEDLEICSAPMWASPGLDYSWATTTSKTSTSDASTKSGPRAYMPEGNRFTIDDPDSRKWPPLRDKVHDQ